MFTTKRSLVALLSAIGLIGFASNSFAASAGTDNASLAAYSPNWVNASNGEATGDAFLPWSLASVSGSGSAGFFTGDSTQLNSGSGGNINVSGDSWGLFANGDPTAIATAQRFFTSNGTSISALSVGQTFSISIAVNFTDNNRGFNLLDSGSNTLFDLNIGSNFYSVNSNNLPNQTYSANTVFALTFTQTSLTSGTWTLARTGGQTDSAGGTYNGDAAGLKLYIQDTSEGGGPEDLFANSLAVTAVPEASTVGLVACGTGVLFLLSKRRRLGRSS